MLWAPNMPGPALPSISSSPRDQCPHVQDRLLSPSSLKRTPQATTDCAPQTAPGTTQSSSHLHALMFHVPFNCHPGQTAQAATPPCKGLPTTKSLLVPSSSASSSKPAFPLASSLLNSCPTGVCHPRELEKAEGREGKAGEGMGLGANFKGTESIQGRSCLAAPVASQEPKF